MNALEKLDWDRNMVMQDILRSKMLDMGRIVNLMHLIGTVPRTGVIAEFGVYQGNTAVLMAMMSDLPLWLYDSFEGLPEPDEGCAVNFQKGKLASTIDEVKKLFRLMTTRRPERIVKGWFEQLTSKDLPEKFSFVHLDADMYAGTYAVLEHVYPRLIPGGIVVIDDYGHPGLPGVQAAVRKFMGNRPETVWKLQTTGASGQAYFTKQYSE